ncbi:hydrogenase maturation protease [Lutibacter sp. HS1-25]|uniref:hydrogenase maturation protease n=1 Tax=Lutibacter sp. HS1-25 TaxID=2485000 RepID=UPI00101228FC|nr:hydrogenase maturation protease [Lutibacter sp. HS1-25]RXP53642.1 hydrogenase maturation protease [Lutibacter sp. HS1-25]
MKKLDNTLIIGIGNNTRQDDGLGWCFLDALVKNGFNEEKLLYKYQLMVEDTDLIAKYKTVFFVDANKTALNEGFLIEKLTPSKKVSFSTHAVPPNQILNLCETIYHKKPTAYLIKIEGYEWDFKIELSKKASENLKNAIKAFIKEF